MGEKIAVRTHFGARWRYSIVFADGIGERAPEVCARIYEGVKLLGLKLDPSKNMPRYDGHLQHDQSWVGARIIQTDEDVVIAQLLARWRAFRRCIS